MSTNYKLLTVGTVTEIAFARYCTSIFWNQTAAEYVPNNIMVSDIRSDWVEFYIQSRTVQLPYCEVAMNHTVDDSEDDKVNSQLQHCNNGVPAISKV